MERGGGGVCELRREIRRRGGESHRRVSSQRASRVKSSGYASCNYTQRTQAAWRRFLATAWVIGITRMLLLLLLLTLGAAMVTTCRHAEGSDGDMATVTRSINTCARGAGEMGWVGRQAHAARGAGKSGK